VFGSSGGPFRHECGRQYLPANTSATVTFSTPPLWCRAVVDHLSPRWEVLDAEQHGFPAFLSRWWPATKDSWVVCTKRACRSLWVGWSPSAAPHASTCQPQSVEGDITSVCNVSSCGSWSTKVTGFWRPQFAKDGARVLCWSTSAARSGANGSGCADSCATQPNALRAPGPLCAENCPTSDGACEQ